MVQIGQTVNGYTIVAIAGRSLELHELVILGESDANYVTARMDPNNDEEWYWGHYHYKGRDHAKLNAWADFYERMKH
jgi:hypothetical protein